MALCLSASLRLETAGCPVAPIAATGALCTQAGTATVGMAATDAGVFAGILDLPEEHTAGFALVRGSRGSGAGTHFGFGPRGLRLGGSGAGGQGAEGESDGKDDRFHEWKVFQIMYILYHIDIVLSSL